MATCERKTVVSISITPEVVDRLDEKCKTLGTSRSAFVQDVIAAVLGIQS